MDPSMSMARMTGDQIGDALRAARGRPAPAAFQPQPGTQGWHAAMFGAQRPQATSFGQPVSPMSQQMAPQVPLATQPLQPQMPAPQPQAPALGNMAARYGLQSPFAAPQPAVGVQPGQAPQPTLATGALGMYGGR